MRELELNSVKVDVGMVLSALGKMWKLESLVITGTEEKWTGMDGVLCNMPELRYLDISENMWTWEWDGFLGVLNWSLWI